jgi:hypothetical protein
MLLDEEDFRTEIPTLHFTMDVKSLSDPYSSGSNINFNLLFTDVRARDSVVS